MELKTIPLYYSYYQINRIVKINIKSQRTTPSPHSVTGKILLHQLRSGIHPFVQLIPPPDSFPNSH